MIFRYLAILDDAPEIFLVLIAAFAVALLVGLVFHEFSHALIADGLGDRTPRALGRLTLRPLPHLDPVGSMMIFLIGFGWAKPVPVNPYNTRNPKRSMTLIAAAGPVSNLVMAGLAAIPIKLGLVPFIHLFVNPYFVQQRVNGTGDLLALFLGTVVLLNVLLAVFNFIPLAPLDGFRVLVGLLPDDLSRELARLEPWGPGLLLLLILVPFISNGEFNPLFEVMNPAIQFLLDVFVGNGGQISVA